MKYFILAIIPVLLAALYFRGLFLEKKRRREIYDSFINDYGPQRAKNTSITFFTIPESEKTAGNLMS